MIINALSEAYDRLCSNSDIEIMRDGYSYEKVPLIAVIGDNGELIDLVSNTERIFLKGKNKEEAKRERLPERIPRTSVVPNFLCDTFSYVLGLEIVKINEDGKKSKVLKQTDKARKSFDSFKEKIVNDLKDVPGENAAAVLKFYKHWKPENETQNEFFFYKDKNGEKKLKDLNGNIIFALNSVNKKTIDDKDIINKWATLLQNKKVETSEKGVTSQCCISGEKDIIARTHFPIKGVMGAQSSGAAIVSYNSPSFESYNKEQSYNGPISEEVMRKYTAALNYFLQSGSKNKIIIGNETLVFWAESENEDYIDEIWDLLGIKPTESNEEATESKVMSALNHIRIGQVPLDFMPDDVEFHLLALSPNAGRISVRRYYNTTLGAFRDNMLQHYKDMMLLNSKGEFRQIAFGQILNATVPSTITEDRGSKINPGFSGALFEAAINNYPYPSALFAEIVARVKTDNAKSDDKQRTAMLVSLTSIRAAFIKAYIIRKGRKYKIKEEINLELNKNNLSESYLLGRLFAVMEKTQQDAIPSASSTIKDRFFASACSTPAIVFPSLLIGYQNHIAKLDKKGIRYEKLLDEIISKLSDGFPRQLDLDGQGRFILGYYQQRANLWTKQNNNEENESKQEEE